MVQVPYHVNNVRKFHVIVSENLHLQLFSKRCESLIFSFSHCGLSLEKSGCFSRQYYKRYLPGRKLSKFALSTNEVQLLSLFRTGESLIKHTKKSNKLRMALLNIPKTKRRNYSLIRITHFMQ